jgi:hypothetical protein
VLLPIYFPGLLDRWGRFFRHDVKNENTGKQTQLRSGPGCRSRMGQDKRRNGPRFIGKEHITLSIQTRRPPGDQNVLSLCMKHVRPAPNCSQVLCESALQLSSRWVFTDPTRQSHVGQYHPGSDAECRHGRGHAPTSSQRGPCGNSEAPGPGPFAV